MQTHVLLKETSLFAIKFIYLLEYLYRNGCSENVIMNKKFMMWQLLTFEPL